MKLTRIERLYGGLLLVVLAGIVIHAPLSVWLGTQLPRYSLLIKSWKEILLLIASALAIVIITRRRLWQQLWQDWLVRLSAAYILLHLLLALLLPGNVVPKVAGLLIDLRFVGFMLLLFLLMKIAPWQRLRLLIAAAAGAVVVMGFGALQLFLPRDILSGIGYSKETIMPYLTVDKNPDYVRINSTLRGPNPLGAYAVIVFGFLASIIMRQRFRLKTTARRLSFAAMTIASAAVLWVSYSRSALLGAVLTVAAAAVFGMARLPPRRHVIIAGVTVVVIIGIIAAALAQNTNFVANVILHDNPTTGAKVTSNQGHLSSLEIGVRQLAAQPLGAGVGSTGSASLLGGSGEIVENQYLFVAHEAGWLGLGLFASLYVLILSRLYRDRRDWLSLAVFASGIGLALIGLLLPVWTDDTVSLVWWGLAGIALGTMKGDTHEPRKSQ